MAGPLQFDAWQTPGIAIELMKLSAVRRDDTILTFVPSCWLEDEQPKSANSPWVEQTGLYTDGLRET